MYHRALDREPPSCQSPMFLRFLALAALLVPASVLHARGASPYITLHESPEIERAIERVLILADDPVLTRPIPAARVLDALSAACEIDAPLCSRSAVT